MHSLVIRKLSFTIKQKNQQYVERSYISMSRWHICWIIRVFQNNTFSLDIIKLLLFFLLPEFLFARKMASSMPLVVAEVKSSYVPRKMSRAIQKNSYEMRKRWSSIHFYSKNVSGNGYYQAPSAVEVTLKHRGPGRQILYLPLHNGGVGLRIILLWTALCMQ